MRWPSRFRLMSGVDLRGMLALLASRGAGDEEGTNGVAVMEAQVVGPGVLDFEAVVSAGVGRNSSVVLLEGTWVSGGPEKLGTLTERFWSGR